MNRNKITEATLRRIVREEAARIMEMEQSVTLEVDYDFTAGEAMQVLSKLNPTDVVITDVIGKVPGLRTAVIKSAGGSSPDGYTHSPRVSFVFDSEDAARTWWEDYAGPGMEDDFKDALIAGDPSAGA